MVLESLFMPMDCIRITYDGFFLKIVSWDELDVAGSEQVVRSESEFVCQENSTWTSNFVLRLQY